MSSDNQRLYPPNHPPAMDPQFVAFFQNMLQEKIVYIEIETDMMAKIIM
jgi:hypothetical protein